MSSEIRAGDNRTYWIISNGNSYVDGVTDPNLVTTVGNGWHVYWIGSDFDEYLASCQTISILPRNTSPDTNTTTNLPVERISARQIRLWLINNGHSLVDVENAINSIEDETVRQQTLVEWEYAPYVERNHPLLLQIAQVLNLTENDVDMAFLQASAI